jgi:hypothetical protein
VLINWDSDITVLIIIVSTTQSASHLLCGLQEENLTKTNSSRTLISSYGPSLRSLVT